MFLSFIKKGYGDLNKFFCPVCKKEKIHTFSNVFKIRADEKGVGDYWDGWVCTTCERLIKVKLEWVRFF